MNKLNKKIVKVSYKMYVSGNFKVRAIKNHIRDTYNVILKENIFTEWFGPKPNHNEYSPITKRKIVYLYCSVSNTNLVREYLNEKYNTQFQTNLSLTNYVSKFGEKKRANYLMSSNALIPHKVQYDILKMYKNGMSAQEIFRVYQEKYGYKTPKSITDILKKFGVNPWQEYTNRCDDAKSYKNFRMNIIDDGFKGYFYGLMLTDGWVSTEDNIVGIQLTDEDAISYCAQNIGCSYMELKKKAEHYKLAYRIFLTSELLKGELISKGIVPKKSLILDPPKLSDSEELFLPQIFKGIIDGDGWIRKDGKEFFICSASKLFLQWCQFYLEKLGMENLEVRKKPTEEYDFYLIRTACNKNIEILKTVIYKDDFGMKRKFQRVHSDERSETIIETL